MDGVASPASRTVIAWGGIVLLGLFLAVHVIKDLTAPAAAWYFRSTPVWGLMMVLASVVFWRGAARLRAAGISLDERCATLPTEGA